MQDDTKHNSEKNVKISKKTLCRNNWNNKCKAGGGVRISYHIVNILPSSFLKERITQGNNVVFLQNLWLHK